MPDPNNQPKPAPAPTFIVATNWQSTDPNITLSSPGLNFMVADDPNLCIDIAGGSTDPNTPVQTYACNGFDAAQAWFLFNGQLHTQSGMCLDTDADDVNQALNVVTQPCDTTGTRHGQQWNYTSGLLQITNSDRCLTVVGPANGVRPQLTACNFPDTRQSFIGARTDGTHTRGSVISSALSGSACLYVDNSSNDGTALTLSACNFGVMEQFVLEGTHLLALGKCVQAANTTGTGLTLETCSNDVSQQWVWSNGNLLLAADLRKCVGLVNNNTASGAPVQVQSCAGVNSQQWALGAGLY